jgi:lipopolysaccharide/colanic/teichoic acid biosynthesis glycosyltransferase
LVSGQREFLLALRMERKRTERSDRPFLLMLLDSAAFSGSQASLRNRAIEALQSMVRDIDKVGWYKDHSILGVVFSEITYPTAAAVQAIQDRVMTALAKYLSEEELDSLHFSLHLFPETEESDKSLTDELNSPIDLTLYPELVKGKSGGKLFRVVKRTMDVVGSAIAILLLSPLMLVITVAIKLTSKGPVLFRQERVGLHGVPFEFLKFRSMDANSDEGLHEAYVAKFIAGEEPAAPVNGKSVYKMTDDPRVTAVGRFLRRSSMDEVPQFFNVLKGEMSLVGPRPALCYEVNRYRPWHRRRILEAKPGLTGLWQVRGRSRTTFDEMVRLDLQYVREASLLLDLKILLKTPLAVFSGEGAH